MVDRVCQQETNRYRCRENAAEAVENSPAFARMDPDVRAEIMDALAAPGADGEYMRDVYALVTADGRQPLSVEGWQAVLGALEENRSEGAVARLSRLVTEPGFVLMSGAEADREAERAAEGVAFSVGDVASRSGVAPRQRSSGFSPTGAAELGGHGIAEGVAHGAAHWATHATGMAMAGTSSAILGTVAVGASSGAAVAFGVYAVLHEIAEAHQEGDRLGAEIQYAQGIVDELEHRMGGPPPGAQSAAGASGSDRADELWEGLSPAQRATLRALSPADRDTFVEGLRLLIVEQRAIAGR